MSIRQLLSDDDAVSPVIGVILMVAITVILAAVIGAFVLGFGDSTGSAPTIDADASQESAGEDVTFTINSAGENISASNLYIRGDALNDSDNEIEWSGSAGAGSTFTVNGTTELGSSGTLSLVWDDGSTSNSVMEFEAQA